MIGIIELVDHVMGRPHRRRCEMMMHCKICDKYFDTWTSKAAHGFCSNWCERSPFLPFPELIASTVKTILLLLIALSLTCGTARAQDIAAQPEQWVTINSDMKFRIAQVGMTESDGKGFEAYIVENLPHTDIIGAPESIEMHIRGLCRAKVYGVGTIQKFSGKMGDGDSLGGFTAGLDYPDDTRRVEPRTVMDKVFEAGCK
jgi:hypothetical protein